MHISRILRAQRINRLLGGVVVLPWELDEIPDDWLTAFELLSDDMPRLQKGLTALDAAFSRAKAKFTKKR